MSKVKVEIPEEIYNKIKEIVDESEEFASVEEYITFVLEEILKEDEEESEEEHVYSEEEEEEIKERLRSLGYL